MKKKLLPLLLVCLLTLTLLPLPGLASTTPCPSEEEVTQAILALKYRYPEGTPWTDDDYYSWKFARTSYGGYGCVAFAYLASDAAFGVGVLPPVMIKEVHFSDVRPGDILRINGGFHSVIVMEVNADSVTVAEGNFNRSVHYGRTLSKETVEGAEYMFTRYPDVTGFTSDDPCADGHTWTEWIVTREPTCTKEGWEAHYCLYCTAGASHSLYPLGHDYQNGICTRCGDRDPAYSRTPDAVEVHFDLVCICPPGLFPDVRSSDWFSPSVSSAVQFGLMKGNDDRTFNPYGSVTLAEAVTIAARMHSIYTTGGENFIQGNPWYQCYLDYAAKNGILTYQFSNPNRKATRAQCAEFFANALPNEALAVINDIADNAIPDVDLYDHCTPGIYQLYRAGVLTGSDDRGTFYPDSSITRAECAAIVSRMAESSSRVTFSLD